jgi:hypothetical protein
LTALRSASLSIALLALCCSPISAHQERLSDLRDYYELRVGPFASKPWPQGAICHIGNTCHCDWNSSYLISAGGIGGPSKSCGLDSYFEDSPRVINGRRLTAAREFHYSRKQIVGRYGSPTYRGEREADSWSYVSYCTTMDGKNVSGDNAMLPGEYYQYAFAFRGNGNLSEIAVSWTKRCDPKALGYPPIP